MPYFLKFFLANETKRYIFNHNSVDFISFSFGLIFFVIIAVVFILLALLFSIAVIVVLLLRR